MRIIIVSQAKFDDLNKRALQHIQDKYNSDAIIWSNPLIHPKSGKIAFKVKDQIEAILTDTEKSKSFELTEDWIPELWRT